jgi:hypothetical protein
MSTEAQRTAAQQATIESDPALNDPRVISETLHAIDIAGNPKRVGSSVTTTKEAYRLSQKVVNAK